MLEEQRTIVDEILREESILEKMSLISKKLIELQDQIKDMSRNGKIHFQLTDFKRDAHLYLFANQADGIVKKNSLKGQRRPINRKSVDEENAEKSKNYKTSQRKFTKLPTLG